MIACLLAPRRRSERNIPNARAPVFCMGKGRRAPAQILMCAYLLPDYYSTDFDFMLVGSAVKMSRKLRDNRIREEGSTK